MVKQSKVEKILKGSLDSMPSPSVQIQIMGGKVCLRCKSKTLLGIINKLLKTKSLLTMISNVLPLRLKQTFPPIIWICTEGDGIKSRLHFKIFSTLIPNLKSKSWMDSYYISTCHCYYCSLFSLKLINNKICILVMILCKWSKVCVNHEAFPDLERIGT